MYLDSIADEIKAELDSSQIPEDSQELFRIYALLVLGSCSVTDEEVHAAWSVWMASRDPSHQAIRPFNELTDDVQEMDAAYRDAIRAVAGRHRNVDTVLFPLGPDAAKSDTGLLDLYRLMVSSSEALVDRRQSVNTFFVTINGALLTAIGLVVRFSAGNRVVGLGLLAIGIAGLLFSLAWKSLIRSFGQLNTGKFRVINRLEDFLPARIYAAEWEALGRGEDPKIYRSFTSREIWVPWVAVGIYVVVIVASGTFAAGWWSL